MRASEFITKHLKERHNVFFNAINFSRAVEQRRRKKAHSWKEVNYKIYPSSIKSLTMCPKRYVEEDVHKAPSFALSAIYKMEIGKTVHTLLQDEALRFDPAAMVEVLNDMAESYAEALQVYTSTMYKVGAKDQVGLLYGRPTVLPELQSKLDKNWPEVPGYDPPSGFSFRSDLVLNKNDYPAVLDIKTTAIEADRWDFYKEDLPQPEHLLQVRFYRYFFNKHKYYDKLIREIGLGYVNLLMPQGSDGSEHETWYDFGETEDQEIKELTECLGAHREVYIKSDGKETRDCFYSKCAAHAK